MQSAVVVIIGLQLTRMNENSSKYRRKSRDNTGRRTKSRSKKNYSHKRYHGKQKRECDKNNKTDLQVQNVVL